MNRNGECINENKDLKKGLGIHARRVIAYIVLIIITFFCLFWFYVLFINATRSNGELQAGFTRIAKHTSAGKLEQSGTRNTSGMAGYVQQSDRMLTCQQRSVYLFFNHDGICHSCI